MPKVISGKKSLKIPLNLFCVGSLLLDLGPALTCSLYTPWDFVGKKKKKGQLIVLCKRLPIGDSFLVRSLGMETNVHFSISVQWHDLAWTCACCHSPCEFLCAEVLRCLEVSVSLVSPTPLALKILMTPCAHNSLPRKEFDWGIPFRERCNKIMNETSMSLLQMKIKAC